MRLRDLEGKSVLMACEIERSVRSFLAEPKRPNVYKVAACPIAGG